MNIPNFFAELKRRNVYKVAIAYAVVAWLLMQVATQVFPFLEIPNWAIRLVIMLIVIGFPIALMIAWAFELTPEGLKRTEFAEWAGWPGGSSLTHGRRGSPRSRGVRRWARPGTAFRPISIAPPNSTKACDPPDVGEKDQVSAQRHATHGLGSVRPLPMETPRRKLCLSAE